MQRDSLIGRPLSVLAASACALLLTACGGAPSDSDIQAAVKKQVEQEQAALRKMSGPGADLVNSLTPQIKEVKKIGCKADGEKAYKCDVEMVFTLGGQEQRTPTSLRFVKTGDGWSVMR